MLQQVVSQPFHPRADTMTAEELRQSYSGTVKDTMMLLHMLHRPDGTQQHLPQQPLQQLAELWFKHFHLVVSLSLRQRGDLMFK